MHRSRVVPWFALGVVLAFSGFRAEAAVPQRIGSVDNNDVAPVRGGVNARARQATDLGPSAADTVLHDMTLRFTMTAAQQSALTQLLADQQNPASSRYHQWLTPEQFRAQFGLGDADTQTVKSWLAGQGFSVTEVARGGTFVRFSGTAAQVEKAFHTQIHKLSLNGETHYANLSDPQLPSAIAAVTGGITGLHDFHPVPHHRHQVVAASTSGENGASPRFTSSVSGNHYLAPGDFYTIYDESALLSSNINGAGVTIAVMGQTDVTLSYVDTFRSVSGLSKNTPTVKLYGTDPGTASSSDVTEAELDLEWAGATAPGASILYVNSKDVINVSLTDAIDNNVAPILSVSYGECEASAGQATLQSYSTLFQMANAQGQTIVSAAGDSGATDCDYQVSTATQGLAVDFPAALPNVTGVGGTMYSDSSGTYWNSTNGTYNGSAISYIPESVWNETSSSGLAAGGGGASKYFTKPSWQTGTGVPADGARDVPDVSLNAASSHDGYLICGAGCSNGYRDSSGYLDVVGGTSVGAPSFAGLLALVEQKTGSRIGNANPTIYGLANSAYYSTVFHDVISGNNSSPCRSGTTNCPSGGSIGFSAGTGYDQASGWGSVDAFNLVMDWGLISSGLTVSTTTVSLSSSSVAAGTSVTVTAKVASSSKTTTTTPSGTVQFTVDGTTTGSAMALSGGSASYTLNTSSLTNGSHTIAAIYSGDSTYTSSTGSAALTITGSTAPDFTLTPATVAVTATSGKAAPGVTFTVAAANGFAGNVTFTVSSTGLNGEYGFSVNPVVLSSTTASGTTVLTLYAYSTSTGLSPVSAVKKPASPFTTAGAGVLAAGLLVLVMPRRRRLASLMAAFVMAGMLFASGCGSGGTITDPSTIATTTNTTAGSYTVTVTASGTSNGTSVSHSSTVTLTVQ